MSTLNILNIKTHYLDEGMGQALVCLPGWGQNTEMFLPSFNHFKHRFRVIVVDFPGFGESATMNTAFAVDDYVDWLNALLVELKVENPILMAHSFGARVAIKYANLYPVKKMILTGAAGVRPKRSISYYVRVYTFKTLKKGMKLIKMDPQKLSKIFGSSDYQALEGVMRESFVKIVNEDLSPYLKTVQASCLLVWGEKDDATPLWMGQLMEKNMRDAGLVVFKNAGHYAYYQESDRFNRIVDAFIKEDQHG